MTRKRGWKPLDYGTAVEIDDIERRELQRHGAGSNNGREQARRQAELEHMTSYQTCGGGRRIIRKKIGEE